jgi:hypothetical protein
MSKRFTDTEKYRNGFIRALPGAYKLLWDYIVSECDHAGIWYVDFEIAQICVGMDMPVGKDKALRLFNEGEERILELENGEKWFIIPFITFQYGNLSETNPAHKGILSKLRHYNLINSDLEIDLQSRSQAPREGLRRGLEAPKDKDKEIYRKTDRDKKGDKEESVGKDVETGSTQTLPEPEGKTWRDSFEIYLNDLRAAYSACIRNRKWLDERQKYHPKLNISLSLEKACKDYWAKEAGWKKKKSSRSAKIDWVRTFNNALTIDCNRVWKTKEQIENETKKQKRIIRVDP